MCGPSCCPADELVLVPPGGTPARRRKRADNAGVAQVLQNHRRPGEQDGTYWLGGYCPIQALPARALHVETVRQLKVNKRQTPGCEGNQQAMTTQVNRCIENLRRVEAIKGCVLDQDDTLADLIGARSYKPHPEAGYTTDNLLLSLTVECLAMREETIYVPPGNAPVRTRGGCSYGSRRQPLLQEHPSRVRTSAIPMAPTQPGNTFATLACRFIL